MLTRVDLSWVISFTTLTDIDMHKINDCLSKFIMETFLKEINDQPNNVLEAVCTSFLALTFADHRGVVAMHIGN